MGVRSTVSEQDVCRLWNGQRFAREGLRSEDGRAVSCVYRGRWRHGAGPDFVDALVAFDGVDLQRGDVEVHVRTGEWTTHGHQRDHGYDNVILHVVFHHDGAATTTAAGRDVPTLALERRVTVEDAVSPDEDARTEWPREPCRGVAERRGPYYVGAVLERAGLQRLAEKAATLEAEAAVYGADQALYAAFLDALGYGANREPCRALAARLPYRVLNTILSAHPVERRGHVAEALLLGAAGLLGRQEGTREGCPHVVWSRFADPQGGRFADPQGGRSADPQGAATLETQRPRALFLGTNGGTEGVHSGALAGDDGYWSALAGLWERYGGICEGTAPVRGWRSSAVRPANAPSRRVAAAAQLLARLAVPLPEAIPALAAERAPSALAASLAQWLRDASRSDGYWATHYAFGRPLHRPLPHLIGSERAADIVANVFLPFLVSVGVETAREGYRTQPRLGENELTRTMAAMLGVTGKVVTTGCRQQGLIHVYRRYCRDQRCGECPLGGA